MKDDKYFFYFNKQPGLELKKIEKIEDVEPKVSIITSYYNAQKYMWQTINCVFNQTFPFWEWIIVDDGSTDKESIKYLEEIKKLDKRIIVLRKENEGLAKGRDYAIKYASTNYILPLDADDLIENTYIETLYWMMETNLDASWAFTNSLGFERYIYLTDELFDSDIMKNRNQITATALIRKERILELDGYSVAKRYVNEDWHLWLRMLANEEFPVQATFYGFWYRRRKNSLLSEVNDEKKEENNLRLRDLKIEADKIKDRILSRVYPSQMKLKGLEYNKLEYNNLKFENERNGILYIIPEIGFNNKMQRTIENNSIKNDIYIISIENSEKSQYANRQNLEKYSTIYNLSSFLDEKYFLGFIEYIVNTRNIKRVYLSKDCKEKENIKEIIKNSEYINYKNSNFLYNLNILKYKFNKFIVIRAIKKIYRLIIKNERMKY